MAQAGEVLPMPDLQVIEETAALWVMRLDSEDLSETRRQQMQTWLAASDRHRTAFDRLAVLWNTLDTVEVLADYKAANDRAEVSRPYWKPARWMAAAASLLIGIFVATAYWAGDIGSTANNAVYANTFSSGVGEQKVVEMPDGSLINLNTDSSMTVTFSTTGRDVHLMRGEAYFEVAKDAARPFSVRTARGIVTALGTAFTVRVHPEAIDLVVSEGVVSLTSLAAKEPVSKIASVGLSPTDSSRHVSAGQSVIFDGSARIVEEVSLPTIERKLAWREGMLDFDGEPLGDVLRDLGRYTKLTIEIEDEALETFPVSGRFKIGEINATLEALEVMVGVKIQYLTSEHVRISKAG